MSLNQHLLSNLSKAEKALKEVSRCGAVAVSLDLNGAHPTIEIDRAGQLANRTKAWSKHTGNGIVRCIEQCVIVNECQIVWQEH